MNSEPQSGPRARKKSLSTEGKPPERFAVLGDPISQSRSPRIQNAFLEAAGISATYGRFQTSRQDLPSRLEELFEAGYRGLNLTYPLKELGAELSQPKSDWVSTLGAVNTLIRGPDGWIGTSTDGEGLLLALRRGSSRGIPKRILVLGAGGAARSAILALGSWGQGELWVLNRSRARFDSEFFRSLPCQRSLELVAPDDPGELPWEDLDLLVHATPFGLGNGFDTPAPWPLGRLPSRCQVLDMNYGEGPTAFLRSLPEAIQGQDGRGMLVGQALLAFEAWTGIRPDYELGFQAGFAAD